MESEHSGLTEAQKQKYEKDGFIVEENCFCLEDVDHYRQVLASPEIEGEVRQREDYEKKTVHLLNLTARHPEVLKLARDPRIVERIKPLLGEDIQLQHSKLGTKPPTKGEGEFHWHQDLFFYPHTNTSLLTVAVWLDDCTLENGCLQMVRGSQKLGYLNHLEEDGKFRGACQVPAKWQDDSGIEDITCHAGAISIHHCLTLHGSPPNKSGKPRRAIIFSYRADDAYQLADNVFKDTGVLICGERKGIVRLEAGLVTLPRKANREWDEEPYGSAWNQVGELAKANPSSLYQD